LGAILALLARPLIQMAVSAFGQFLLDAMKTWMADRNAQALGRAEATRDAAVVAAKVEQEMAEVPEPDIAELLKRLRDGEA
jgi:hypothetical protein